MKLDIKGIKFSKHYTVIAVICLIAIIIVFYIYYLISAVDGQITDNKDKIDLVNRRIKSLYRSTPSPTRDNINLIKDDSNYLQNEVFKLKAKLGNPYIKPLEQILITLNNDKDTNSLTNSNNTTADNSSSNSKPNEDTLETFLLDWTKYYNKVENKEGNSIRIFSEFLESKGYSKDKINKAVNSFRNYLSINTIIQPSYAISTSLLTYSIGLPLTISRIQCRSCIKEAQSKFSSILKKYQMISKSTNFTAFNEFKTMPNDDQIPYIINYLWFYDDLIKRLIDSKVKTLRSYKKLNGLRGGQKNDVNVLKYEVTIVAPFSSIRTLLNSFQNSYKDNRIYKVDSVSFTELVDDVNKLAIPGKKKKPTIEIDIGRTDLVRAVIKLSYYIYSNPLVTLTTK